MKVLFHSIGRKRKIERAGENQKWEWKTDYQLDSLYHGLVSILGEDLIDSVEFDHMYEENLDLLHGDNLRAYGNPRRFSLYGKIKKRNVDRTDILQKARNGYFDFIFLGLHHADEVYEEEIKEVEEFSGCKNLAFIHGGDYLTHNNAIDKHGPIFKRELEQSSDSIYPISFSIPSELVVDSIDLDKEKPFGSVIPSFMQQATFWETYTFKTEESYLNDYKKSLFGLTCKKGGWDCLRHYEILSTGCVPLFVDIKYCPKDTLTTLPKDMLLEAFRLIDYNEESSNLSMPRNFNRDYYEMIANSLLEYTKKNLTTEKSAKYLLDTTKQIFS